MRTCLFCGKCLDNSSEHILQECLGAKWEAKSILCKSCNKVFGDTIDRDLAEVFNFFCNFLRIRGKRGRIPRLEGLVSQAGEEFVRTGDTGEFVSKNQNKVTVEECEDGSGVVLHIEGEYGYVAHMAEEQRKSFEKKGYTVLAPKNPEYRTEAIGPLGLPVPLSLPVYIALQKSLLNYCRLVLPEEEQARVAPLAHAIHDFAHFCKKSGDVSARAAMASECGLKGFPLIVTATERAQAAIKGDRSLFHALFLIPKADGLYGGVCLFNEMWWGFKLTNEPGFPSGPHLVVFDIGATDKPGKREELAGIDGADFEFSAIEPSPLQEKLNEQFSRAATHCKVGIVNQEWKNSLGPDLLEHAFPLTSPELIRHVLLERAQTILGLVMGRAGIPVGFFRADVGKKIARSPVNELMRRYGPDMRLDKGNYEEVITRIFNMCEHMAKQPEFVDMLKILVRAADTPEG